MPSARSKVLKEVFANEVWLAVVLYTVVFNTKAMVEVSCQWKVILTTFAPWVAFNTIDALRMILPEKFWKGKGELINGAFNNVLVSKLLIHQSPSAVTPYPATNKVLPVESICDAMRTSTLSP